MAAIAKRVIVTGASSGVGAAIARVTAHRGHKFFLTGRNETNLETVCKATMALGAQKATFGAGDVGTEADVDRLVTQALTDLDGGIDVLIANHGTARKGPIEACTPTDYRDVMRTNVKGVFLWLNRVIPHMKKAKKGQIIVMGSIMGSRTNAGSALYAASKHALEGMIGCVRKDLSGSGVKVAMVAPYAINTPWWSEYSRGGNKQPKTAEQKAMMLSPEDVAHAVDVIMEQPLGSDIERIVIEPHKPYEPPKEKPHK